MNTDNINSAHHPAAVSAADGHGRPAENNVRQDTVALPERGRAHAQHRDDADTDRTNLQKQAVAVDQKPARRPRAKARDGTISGIWVDGDVIGDPRLHWSDKALLAYMRARAAKTGEFWAFNANTAEALGMSLSTVKRGLTALKALGLVEGRKCDGLKMRVQMPPDWYAEKGFPDASNLTYEAQNEPASAGQVEPGGGSERTPAQVSLNPGVAQNDPCIRIEQGIETMNKTDEDDKASLSSSSVLIKKEGTAEADSRTVRDWAKQAASMMNPRTWERRQGDATVPVSLKVPTPTIGSPQEIAQLKVFVQELWPGCDPLMGMRHLLRAAASNSDRRDRLQQYAFLATSGSLGARALLRLGGGDDPLAFAREAAAGLPPPPDPVEPGTQEDAELMLRLAYSEIANWTFPCWAGCFAEAAGRCRAMNAPPVLYMATAAYLHERDSDCPLPWIASTLSFEDIRKFYPVYAEDRVNAWSHGRERPHTDPRCLAQDYSDCIGQETAKAAAQGQKRFTSRSCLLCAATELKLVPELSEQVPGWKGRAAELAALLESLAAGTASDVPPFRGTACGIESCGPASFIRCLHGGVNSLSGWGDDPEARQCKAE